MATTIKLKNSVTTTNTPTSLAQGEVAINITDKKVWVGNAATTPIQLLGDGGSVNFTTVDTTNLQVTNIKAKDGTASASIANSTGAFTVAAAFAANGGATLGDASGDALTINSSAVSIPNGLNFDSNTLVIDAANNLVGIGTSSPASALQVLKASANPTLNITRTTSSATTIGDALYLRLNDTTGTSGMRNEIGMGYGIPATTTYTPSLIGYVQTSSSGSTFGDLYFATRSVTTDTAPSERMRIASSGNVVIGATDAQSRLTVNDASSSSTTVGTNPVIWIGGGNGSVNTNSEIGFTYGAASWAETYAPATIGYQLKSGSGYTYGDITFCTRSVTTDTAPTERMRIDSSGSVLVNQTSATNYEVFGGTFSTGLQISGTTVGSSGLAINRYGNVANGANIVLAHSRGASIGTNTIVANGDPLGLINFNGANGTGYDIAAQIRGEVDGTPGASNDMPGRLVFLTTADGASTPTERMRLNSSGNLGLGVTPSAWNSVYKALQINNSASFYGRSNGIEAGFTTNAFRDNVVGWQYINTDAAARYDQQSNIHAWYNAVSGTAGTTIAWTQAMTLNGSGRLFIGTTTGVGSEFVSIQFDSSGTINQAINTLDANASSSNNYHFVMRKSDATYLGGLRRSGTDNAMAVDGNSYLALQTGGTERMRIDSSGRVLVGLTSANTSGANFQVSSGVTFPATQSASSDANTLDDYEEGTWTPTAVGGTTAGTTTYLAQAGTYTKVGRMVTVNGVLDISNMTGTGNIVIGGLPFSVLLTSGTIPCGSIIAGSLTLPATGSLVYAASGNTSGVLYVVSSGAGYQTVAVDTTWSAYFTITYQVA